MCIICMSHGHGVGVRYHGRRRGGRMVSFGGCFGGRGVGVGFDGGLGGGFVGLGGGFGGGVFCYGLVGGDGGGFVGVGLGVGGGAVS